MKNVFYNSKNIYIKKQVSMKSNLFLSLFIFLCILSCKNTPKEVVTEKEKTIDIDTTTNVMIKEEATVSIESTLENKSVNIPQTKVLEVVIQKDEQNTPKQLPDIEILPDEPNVDSRLKFKLEEINSDELDSKICGLFETIEEKILAGDFDGWYNSLSINYRSFIENPDELLKMSKKSGYLKRKKIVLRTAEDYFTYIVIPSREGVALKYVDFQQIDEKNIKVNCMLDDKHNFVYDFVYEKESWKLDKK